MMKDLLTKVLSVVVSRGLLKVASFLSFLVLARALGPEGFGLFGVFSSAIFIVAAAGNLGVRQSAAYEIGQQTLSFEDVQRAIMVIWPPMSVLAGGCVMFLLYDTLSGSMVTWSWLTLITVSSVILIALQQGIFLGLGEITAFNLSELLSRCLLLATLIGLWAVGRLGLIEAVAAFTVSYAIVAVVTRAITLRVGDRGARTCGVWSAVTRLVMGGWPYAITLALILLNARLSVFLLARLVEGGAAGYFFVGVRMNEVFLESATAVGLVFFSHSVKSHDPRETLAQAGQVTRWLVVVMLSTVALAAAVVPILVPPLLGTEFLGAVPVLRILVVGLPFVAITRVLYQTIAGLGTPLVGAAAYTPAIILNAVLSVLMIPRFGEMGAAVAWIISQGIVGTILVAYIWRKYGVPPTQMLVIKQRDVFQVRKFARSVWASMGVTRR